MSPPVRIFALGGLGEVGMNCTVLECEGRLAVVDCGILFPNEPIGVDLIAPDIRWLADRSAQVGAIFLTHGHEDHVGALALLLAAVKAPVYGTRFTLAMVRRRLEEAGLDADLRKVVPGDVREAGDGSPFVAEWIAMTHSIPEACALAIDTPQGTILHSGDFKLDPRPVAGPPPDLARLRDLGRRGVRLLLSDSTNAEKRGRSRSESDVRPALEEAFETTNGRVVVACFASNIHRMQQIVDVARAEGRRVAFLGRSMETNCGIAREFGMLTLAPWQPVGFPEARELPPRELCVITTGTQGEPRSALARLSRGEHPDLRIAPGDLVILSSRSIPGNEIATGQVVNDLLRLGVEVLYDGARVHASGHAHEDELREVIRLVRPEQFVPVHGEYRQLHRHAAHAAAEGLPPERVHLLLDGQVLELSDDGARVLARPIPTGRVYVDRDSLGAGEVGALVVRDRRLLAEAGLVIAVLAVEKASGAAVRGPDLFAVGVAGFEGAEEQVRGEALRAFEELTPAARGATEEAQEALRLAIRRWFRRETGKRPTVLPIVLEL
ncbi:MAG: ribonuclease J [Anaeromyxobacteraceae bacterium]